MAKPPQLPRVAEVVALVRPLVSEISPERLTEIVHTVAPVPLTQRLLELALIKQPGVLEGQHANVPATVQNLAHALVKEGASRVVLPTCESCGRAVRMPHKTPGGTRSAPASRWTRLKKVGAREVPTRRFQKEVKATF